MGLLDYLTRSMRQATLDYRSRQRLPMLNGQLTMPGIGAVVTVQRDAVGVPTVQAQQMSDLFFGLGVIHAQDRPWQMVVSRSCAAGCATDLLGDALTAWDNWARRHNWMNLAERLLNNAGGDIRAQLHAYTAGVNCILARTHELPIQFDGQLSPPPWRPVDSLAIFAMWLDVMRVPSPASAALGDLLDGLPATYRAELVSPNSDVYERPEPFSTSTVWEELVFFDGPRSLVARTGVSPNLPMFIGDVYGSTLCP